MIRYLVTKPNQTNNSENDRKMFLTWIVLTKHRIHFVFVPPTTGVQMRINSQTKTNICTHRRHMYSWTPPTPPPPPPPFLTTQTDKHTHTHTAVAFVLCVLSENLLRDAELTFTCGKQTTSHSLSVSLSQALQGPNSETQHSWKIVNPRRAVSPALQTSRQTPSRSPWKFQFFARTEWV